MPGKPLFVLTAMLPSILMFVLAAIVGSGKGTHGISALFLVAIGIALLVEEVARWKYLKRRNNNDDC